MGKLTDTELFKLGIRCQLLICTWYNQYPYKRYPESKFKRRFDKLETIEKKIKTEIERRGFSYA